MRLGDYLWDRNRDHGIKKFQQQPPNHTSTYTFVSPFRPMPDCLCNYTFDSPSPTPIPLPLVFFPLLFPRSVQTPVAPSDSPLALAIHHDLLHHAPPGWVVTSSAQWQSRNYWMSKRIWAEKGQLIAKSSNDFSQQGQQGLSITLWQLNTSHSVPKEDFCTCGHRHSRIYWSTT